MLLVVSNGRPRTALRLFDVVVPQSTLGAWATDGEGVFGTLVLDLRTLPAAAGLSVLRFLRFPTSREEARERTACLLGDEHLPITMRRALMDAIMSDQIPIDVDERESAWDRAVRSGVEIGEQRGERRNLVEFPAQPLLAIGWTVPPASHPDSPAVEVAMRLLGAARSSRLERRLIRDEPQCARVFVESGWPGERHSNLAFILAEPLEGADLTQVEASILEEVQTLTTDGPEPDELEGVLRVARIEHLRSLRHGHTLAAGLMSAQASHGSWRAHFHRTSRLGRVTAADVQRVLRERFVRNNSNVVLLRAAEEPAAESEEEQR